MNVLEYLQTRSAIAVILFIHANPGCSKTDVARDSNNERTRLKRIKEGIAIGLIHQDIGNRQHNTAVLTLTPQGQIVAARLDAIRKIMETRGRP